VQTPDIGQYQSPILRDQTLVILEGCHTYQDVINSIACIESMTITTSVPDSSCKNIKTFKVLLNYLECARSELETLL